MMLFTSSVGMIVVSKFFNFCQPRSIIRRFPRAE